MKKRFENTIKQNNSFNSDNSPNILFFVLIKFKMMISNW